MVVLYIILAVIALVCLMLLLTVKLKVYIDRNFAYKVLLGPIPVISDKQKKHKKNKISDNDESSQQEGYLKKLYREKGFSGTVIELFSYLKILFSEMPYVLGKIKIRDFSCTVAVSCEDAATTAVSYGVVSTAVYGFTAFLNNSADFKHKNIKVYADYSNSDSLFELGFTVKIRLIYLLITAFKLMIKFINYKREV